MEDGIIVRGMVAFDGDPEMHNFSIMRELFVALAATLILPLAVLALDYYIRSTIEGGTYADLLKQSGPDCVVLSFGTTGAIFVDPRVSSVDGIRSPLFIIFLVIFLVWMRVACIKARGHTAEDRRSSLRYGVSSLLAIFFVMTFGYVVTALK